MNITMNGRPKNLAQDDFENLVQNGIDFLEKAITQLDDDPKHSVINFYTAVEIFLKAPLVLEYWALVVADRDLNRQKYEDGDFISVPFEEACKRLANALNRPLREEAKKAFDRVRKHRNRMVHFYHNATSPSEKNELRLEQAKAWYELNRYVTEDWQQEFAPFLARFNWMKRTLIANKQYAQAKFDFLASKIAEQKARGVVFVNCPKCGTDAREVVPSPPNVPELSHQRCQVCLDSESKIRVTCPNCGDQNQYLLAGTAFECGKCKLLVDDEDDIYGFLNQGDPRDDDSGTPANCEECGAEESVCEHGGGYLCVSCLAFFAGLFRCEWCGAHSTTEHEASYTFGCNECGGSVEHHANK